MNTIRPGILIPENRRKFYSPEREAKKDGELRNVVPDGVLPLIFENLPFGPTETYADSVFYEAKALNGGSLPLSYEDYQILGFLDALSRSDAASAGRIPAIIFLTKYCVINNCQTVNRDNPCSTTDPTTHGLTIISDNLLTADVKQISTATTAEATFKGVGVFHSIACEIPASSVNNLQLGQASLRNPQVYILRLTLPEFIGPGSPGRL